MSATKPTMKQAYAIFAEFVVKLSELGMEPLEIVTVLATLLRNACMAFGDSESEAKARAIRAADAAFDVQTLTRRKVQS
jgi:hypothetical protein